MGFSVQHTKTRTFDDFCRFMRAIEHLDFRSIAEADALTCKIFRAAGFRAKICKDPSKPPQWRKVRHRKSPRRKAAKADRKSSPKSRNHKAKG
jgi:hypothetical protein